MKYTKSNPSKSTGLKMSKKKRKFRVMTRQEFCEKWNKHHLYCKSNSVGYCCPFYSNLKCFKSNMEKPCKVNGKYILVEVKE